MPLDQLMQPMIRDYSIFTLKGSGDRQERRLLLPQQPTVVILLRLPLVVKTNYCKNKST